MIPKLFTKDGYQYETEGLGRLVDCRDCRVTCSVPNMTYELEFTYLASGPLYEYLIDGAQVVCDTYYGSDLEVFDIYYVSILIDGSKRVRARHQSYRLISYHCFPLAATNDKEAVANIVPLDFAVGYIWDFVWRGSVPVERPLEINKPVSIRNAFAEIKDNYGGYVWFSGTKATYLQEDSTYIGAAVYDDQGTFLCDENGAVIIWDDADGEGIQDRGAEIRHRRDMTSMEWTIDNSNTYTRVLAWWSRDGYRYYAYSMEYGRQMPDSLQRNYLLDVSNDYEAMDQQTIQQIADQYAYNHWQIFASAVTVNVGVNDIQGNLERVRPLDYVTVRHESLPGTYRERVTGWTWDPIRGKYTALTIGEPVKTLADTLKKVEKDVEKAQEKEESGELLYVINCGALPRISSMETYARPYYWRLSWGISPAEDSAILAAASGGKVILQGYLTNHGDRGTEPIELSSSGYTKKLNASYGASVVNFPSSSASYILLPDGDVQQVDGDVQSDDYEIYTTTLNITAEIRNYSGALELIVTAWEDTSGRPFYVNIGWLNEDKTKEDSSRLEYWTQSVTPTRESALTMWSALETGCPIRLVGNRGGAYGGTFDYLSTGASKVKNLDKYVQSEYYKISFPSETKRYIVQNGIPRYLDDGEEIEEQEAYDETIIIDGQEYVIHHEESPHVYNTTIETYALFYGESGLTVICTVTQDDDYRIEVMTDSAYSALTGYSEDTIYMVTEEEEAEEEETDYIYKTITVGGKDYEVVDWDAMRERDGEETP